MKVLCIGDVHIKVNNILESEEMIKRLVILAKERNPDFIVCLGDVLDRHSMIHVQCLMMAEKMTQLLSEIAPFFLIIGNHDRPNNSNFLTDEHPFNAMKKWHNVYIVDKVMEYKNKDFRFIMVPYVPPGRLDEALQSIPEPYKDVACYFVHQEIYLAKMGAIISQCGDKWDLNNSLLVSGHIHDYDNLQPNVIYTGTPIQHTYNENDKKTVSFFIFTNNTEWKQERIDLGMMKKVTFYITTKEVENYQVPKDKIVKLVIKGDESEIKSIAKLEKIQQLKREGVKVVFKATQSIDSVESIETKNSSKMSYKNRFLSEIGKDLNCISWFNKIFT